MVSRVDVASHYTLQAMNYLEVWILVQWHQTDRMWCIWALHAEAQVIRDGISVYRYIGSADISALFEISVIGIGKSQDR